MVERLTHLVRELFHLETHVDAKQGYLEVSSPLRVADLVVGGLWLYETAAQRKPYR